MAAAYGVRVESSDLGDWSPVTVVAEYDPDGPVIRINERALPSVTLSLSKSERSGREIDHAIAHELYHHREAIGQIVRIADRRARERAADAFADDLVRAR